MAKIVVCCDITFQTKDEVKIHRKTVHAAGYQCTQCHLRCTTFAAFVRHKTVHTKKKSFVCEICGYSTVYRHNLKRHQEAKCLKNGEKRNNEHLTAGMNKSPSRITQTMKKQRTSDSTENSVTKSLEELPEELDLGQCLTCGKKFFFYFQFRNKASTAVGKLQRCNDCIVRESKDGKYFHDIVNHLGLSIPDDY